MGFTEQVKDQELIAGFFKTTSAFEMRGLNSSASGQI